MPEENAPTVLLVDDNVQNLQVLANILRDQNCRVATSRDGYKAIKFVEKRRPDLVLLDIMMPGINGYEVCRQLKENKAVRDIPVLFISALSDMEDKLKGFAAGGVDYITKPFHREEVLARVRVHLNLKRARESLEVANHSLMQANAAKDRLLSVISHDLRSPLGGLLSSLDLLTGKWKDMDDGFKLNILHELHTSVKSAYDLMENMLRWANAHQGKILFQPENVPLWSIIDKTLHALSGSIREKSIQVSIEIDHRLMAFADLDMTMSVIRNLVSNAVKFTPDGGCITVSALEREADVAVSVADTGVGVGPAVQPLLFSLEDHVTTLGTRKEKGGGLGLLICREFVEKNGGRIWFESSPGEGSVFTFTLPCSQPTKQTNPK